MEARVALVTGGGSGIGRAIALRLAAEGASVAVAGRREGPLEETVAAAEGPMIAVPGDVAVESDAARMVEQTVEGFGALHVLVAAAGIVRRNLPAHELTLELWHEQLETNLTGVFLTARAAFDAMRATDGDRSVVTVSSGLAHAGARSVAAYAASKGGVESLTRALALEWAEHGIRVNCVLPAIVETPLVYVDRPDFDERKSEFLSSYPLGRLGVPDDIAGAVAYLASPEAAWVTGTVLRVDGGLGIR